MRNSYDVCRSSRQSGKFCAGLSLLRQYMKTSAYSMQQLLLARQPARRTTRLRAQTIRLSRITMLAKSQSTPRFVAVAEPSAKDILCGRGIQHYYYTHHGNLALHAFVKNLTLEEYLSCERKREKTAAMVRTIIDKIFSHAGDRFLKRDFTSVDSCWYDGGGMDAAKSRVRVAFRDAKKKALLDTKSHQHYSKSMNMVTVQTALMKSTALVDYSDHAVESERPRISSDGHRSPTAVSSSFSDVALQQQNDLVASSTQRIESGDYCWCHQEHYAGQSYFAALYSDQQLSVVQ